MGDFLYCSEHLGVQSLGRKRTSALGVTETGPSGAQDPILPSNCLGMGMEPGALCVLHTLQLSYTLAPGFPEPEISTTEYISPHLLRDSFTGSKLLADSSKRSLVEVPQAAVQSCNGCLTLQLPWGFVSADTSHVPHKHRLFKGCYLFYPSPNLE